MQVPENYEKVRPTTCHGRWMSEDYVPGLVSVIIPTYNRARVINRCIDSVLNQTYPDCEIIVIDDGSSDSTPDIVRQYTNINYIRQRNSGVATARNRGLEEAKGEWFAFLDSDDFWHPDKLAIQVKLLNNTNYKVCYTQSLDFNILEDISFVHTKSYRQYVWATNDPLKITAHPHKYNTYIPSMVCHRDTINVSGTFDTSAKISSDVFFMLYISLFYGFIYVDLPLVFIERSDDPCRITQTMHKHKKQYMKDVLRHYGNLLAYKNNYSSDTYKILKKIHCSFSANLASEYLSSGEIDLAKDQARQCIISRPNDIKSLFKALFIVFAPPALSLYTKHLFKHIKPQ